MKRLFLLAAVLGGLSFAGCGGGDGDEATANVQGTWTGTESWQTHTASSIMICNQDGAQITGDWNGFPFTATVAGNTMTLSMAPNNYATGGATITVSGDSMNGSWWETFASSSETVNGTVSLTRTSP